MKIQVQYMSLAENQAINEKVCLSWIGKDEHGKLFIAPSHITEDTACDKLNPDDLLQIKNNISLKIYEIHGKDTSPNRVLLKDVEVGDKLFVAKPSYPDIKHVEIFAIYKDGFYQNKTTYASGDSDGVRSYESRSSLMDDGIIPNTYNRSAAFRTYQEAFDYMKDLSLDKEINTDAMKDL